MHGGMMIGALGRRTQRDAGCGYLRSRGADRLKGCSVARELGEQSQKNIERGEFRSKNKE